MIEKRKYDSTVARIAWNIASGYMAQMSLRTHDYDFDAPLTKNEKVLAHASVRLARAIVAEVERTEPAALPPPRAADETPR